MFVAGTVEGVQGLFRSDDGGARWLRIDDAAHQFGQIQRVTGDPRLHGRVYFATGGRGIVYGDPQ
ncbi:Xyloglucanase precursor [compost metagenome]